MKILITTEFYLPIINGVVTSVVNLKKELTKIGHNVKVLTLSDTIHSHKSEDIIYISSIGAKKIYPGARLSLTKENILIHELMDWSPDIIHTQSEFSTFFIARHIAEKLNIPIIHTYHTVYESYTHYFSPIKSWGEIIAARFTRKVLSQTDGVIAPSNKVYSLLISYGVMEKIFVIPTGITMPPIIFTNQDQILADIKSSLSIPKHKKVLIFIGRLAKEKNLEEIFQFFNKLNRRDLILVVIGDGPYKLHLQSYASELSISQNIRFTGMIKREDINYYYRIGDIFISASNSEAQGLTYIEALSNGIPILCKKDKCLDGIIVDGTNGWQYENFDEFQSQVNEILSHENGYYKLKAINSVYGSYSSEVFAKTIEAAYLETIQNYNNKQYAINETL